MKNRYLTPEVEIMETETLAGLLMSTSEQEADPNLEVLVKEEVLGDDMPGTGSIWDQGW